MISSRDSLVAVVERALSSAFITDPESASLKQWLEDPSRPASDAARDAEAVLRRESGAANEPIRETAQLGSPLGTLEYELLESLETRMDSYMSEKRGLRQIGLGFACATGLSALATASAAILGSADGASAAVGLASTVVLLAISGITARLYQLNRESCERLDERAIAIRFLRIALSNYVTTDQSEILEQAVRMFVGFHGPSSQPLGPEDFAAFSALLSRHQSPIS